jgi:hypothetical protein
MSFTAEQIQEAINAVEDGFDYWELEENGEIPGIGKTEYVASFGGEGQGDSRWIVFKVGEKLFRTEGYYSSWDGTTWDGEVHEVEPFEVKVTEYRRVK